ncbi:Alpha-ketoglutarate-dependent sulfate ester dioxygenase [Halomonadaceae bacterium LMG 33818]|uniref:TauD/TfdA dioxygenase family protein n=1 Tax=Cernens ardua TaxID=3402176 RepID=UPI003EDBFCF7
MSLSISPLTGRIGALIEGLDIANGVGENEFEQLYQALLHYKVVFLRNQTISDEQQEEFSRLFGEQVPHPTVRSHGNSQGILNLDSKESRANSWHTDITFTAAYPKISILRGVKVPPVGGDTLWANTAAAYEDLPAPLKTLAESLWATHSNLYDYAESKNITFQQKQRYQAEFTAKRYETEHPLVRVHPETGERVLVLGHFLHRISGVSSTDSKLLFELFHQYVIRYENTVRWRWKEGDIAIWDNRATEHVAVDDYGQQERIMRRTTLIGEIPISVDGLESRALEPDVVSRSPHDEQEKEERYKAVS